MAFLLADDWPKMNVHRANKVNEGFTDVLLSHAKLYVFAEEKIIPALKRRCLSELHKTLVHFVLTPKGMSDFSALIDYVYGHTVKNTFMSSEPLRRLVCQYCAWKMNTLARSKDF